MNRSHAGSPTTSARVGWICPSAPLKMPTEQQTCSGAQAGTVHSAWIQANWNSTVRAHLRFLGPVTVRVPSAEPPRAGSYSFNYWLLGNNQVWRIPASIYSPHLQYDSETEIVQPSLTPITSDGIDWWAAPRVTDRGPTNLVRGTMESPARGDMKCVAIPRHGSRPSRVPAEYAEAQNLPRRQRLILRWPRAASQNRAALASLLAPGLCAIRQERGARPGLLTQRRMSGTT
jgi:hypothetical protein